MSTKTERLLYIEWDDHSSWDNTWRPKEHYERENRALRCRSVGWVVAENKEAITLCGTRSESKFSGDITILKRCIRKKRRL